MDSDGKRILVVLAEREVTATSNRLLHIPARLAAQGYQVDVMTHDEKFHEKLQAFYGNITGVTVLLLQPEARLWTMQQRDAFAKTFIKLYHDLKIPGTDMYYWKTTAFDDFLWHVNRNVYPAIKTDYDAVWMPVPSAMERPSEAGDVFYTSAAYYCKEKGIPLVGIQVYPVVDLPPIFLRVCDYWIVHNNVEARFFTDKGVSHDRVMVTEGMLDRYCISSLDDVFCNIVLNDQLDSRKDSLVVSLVNHSSNRTQIKEVIHALGRLDAPLKFFFVLIGTTVRELTENDVFQDLIVPVIRKEIGDYYTVEAGGLMRALMLSDVIIGTSYILPLSFAKRYGKQGVVFNPLQEPCNYIEDVEQIADLTELEKLLNGAWERKQQQMWLEDIARRIHS